VVEQFAAVSYGDELFGHFLLIPLQQRHSPSYRKLVWSEHAAVLRVLRTPPEKVILHIILLGTFTWAGDHISTYMRVFLQPLGLLVII
jgi:hypothetical protein